MDPIVLIGSVASSPSVTFTPSKQNARDAAVNGSGGGAGSTTSDVRLGNPVVATLSDVQPRYGATMWLSAQRDSLFIFGGCDEAGAVSSVLQRVNVVSGSVQAVHRARAPRARYFHATVAGIPGQHGRAITYGGCGAGGTVLEDLWEWDREQWTELKGSGDGPGRRHSHQMALSSCGRWVVLVGGSSSHPVRSAADEQIGMACSDPTSATGSRVSAAGLEDLHPPSSTLPSATPLGICVLELPTLLWRTVETPPSLLVGRRSFSLFRVPPPPTQRSGARERRFSSGSQDPGGSVDGSGSTPTTTTVRSPISPFVSGAAARRDAAAKGSTKFVTPLSQLFFRRSSSVGNAGTASSSSPAFATPSGTFGDPAQTSATFAGGGEDLFLVTPGVRWDDEMIQFMLSSEDGSIAVVTRQPVRCHHGEVTYLPRAAASAPGGINPDVAMRDALINPDPCRRAGRIIVATTAAPVAPRATPTRTAVASNGDDTPLTTEVQLAEFGGWFEYRLSKRSATADFVQNGHATMRSVPIGVEGGGGCGAKACLETLHATWSSVMPVAGDSNSISSLSLLSYLSRHEYPAVVDLPNSMFIFGGRDAVSSQVSGALMLVHKAELVQFLKTGNGVTVTDESGVQHHPPVTPNSQSRSSAVVALGGTPSTPGTRSDMSSNSPNARLNTRFQAIVATLGSSARMSKRLASSAGIGGTRRRSSAFATSGPSSDDFKISVLARARESVRRQDIAQRQQLVKDIVAELEKEEAAHAGPREETEVARDEGASSASLSLLLLSGSVAGAREDRHCGDGDQEVPMTTRQRVQKLVEALPSLDWDIHKHYEHLVHEWSNMGMASPITADEGVVAAETAFYLRQSLLQQRKHRHHSVASRTGNGADGDATSAGGNGGTGEADYSGKYREWYHPPLVTRSREEVLHRLAEPAPTLRNSGAGYPGSQVGRGRSARPPPPPLPRERFHSTHDRYHAAALRRDEASSPRRSEDGHSASTPSASARGGHAVPSRPSSVRHLGASPNASSAHGRFLGEQWISADARMAAHVAHVARKDVGAGTLSTASRRR